MLRAFLLFIPLLFSGFRVLDNTAVPVRWLISNGCSLVVDGSTNVNKFSCTIAGYGKADTLTFYRTGGGGPVQLAGRLSLDIQDFDCHNAMMTKDLRKTLKSDLFPVMSVKFLNISRYPLPGEHTTLVKGNVLIGLSGVTKKFEINYRISPEGPTSMSLVGEQQINFSDFNIIPPKKIGGMIYTNDELNVRFSLRMKALN